MPSTISVSTPVQSVSITENSYSVSVVGDTATVSVSTTTPQVNVVNSTSTFTINTIANKNDVGLGNVDNTSDANKPVSTATQTALDTKLNKSGGIMTGSLTLSADPTQNLQAATKGYVDGQVNAVPIINSSDDVAEGSINLYYTSDRANSDFDTRLTTKSTTNVAEGTNLYFTTARARQSISGSGSISYDNTTGQISYTGGNNPTTTDELPEGTINKYYTTARANSDFDTRLATKTTTNLAEGTNLYYTSNRANSDFDTRLATKTTTNLAEGTNLYYTTTRQNTDFDTRLGTKTTTNLAEGTNLYYTSNRANSDFDTRLATKTTDNLSQGTTNKYYSDTLARNAISAGTGISYNSTTGSVAVDTSSIATRSYADSAAASAAAAIVDTAPAALDTLNELAAALGDDPNFATTISTSLGNKLNTGDFNTTADGWLAGKTTTNLAEGTNLYYTDARARGSLSAGIGISYNNTTGVITNTITQYTDALARSAISTSGSLSYNSSTGVISYTTPSTDGITEGSTNLYYTTSRANADFDTRLATKTTTNLAEGTNLYYTDARVRTAVANGVDLAVNGSNQIYVKSLRDGARLLGSLQATTDNSYVFPAPQLNTITNNNGLDAVSSMPANTFGNGASAAFTHYFGDTFAGTNTGPVFAFKVANGNSTTTGTVPFTGLTPVAPSAVISSNILGGLNFNGYATTGFSDAIGTPNQGGGLNAVHAGQIQFAPTETFADGTLTISGATITGVSRVSVAQTVTAIAGTKGQLTIPSTLAGVGTAVIVSGTNSGTGTGITAGTYYIVANNGGASNSTQITLSATVGGAPIDTTAGTVTGLTFTRQLITVTYSAQTSIPFGLNAKVTISGFTNVTSGTFMCAGTSTTTSATIGAPSSGTPALSGSQSISTPTVTAGGTLFRVRGFPAATPLNSANRVEYINHSVATATYKSDQYNFQGGTNTFNYLTANAAAVTAQGSFVVKNLAGSTTYFTIDATGALVNATNGQNLTNTRNYVMGAIRNSTTAAAGDIWALNSTGPVTPFRGINLDNSADTTRGPGTVLRSFSGGAVAGSATRGRVIFEKARGTSAAPTAIQAGDFLGSVDATGYTSTGWLNDNIAAVVPSFYGFAAQENWVSNTNLGTSFTLSLAPTATTITSAANLVACQIVSPQSAAHRADTYTFGQGKSGTANYLSMDSSKITAAIPVAFPAYTRTQAAAITGAVGWQIAISDSSGSGGGRPNGMMAFWDTTNNRWSYIHDNSAL